MEFMRKKYLLLASHLLLIAFFAAFELGCGTSKTTSASASPATPPPATTGTGTTGGTTGTGGTGGGTTGPQDIHAINHIIYMLQENRSFDHYFAKLNTYRVANGWGGPADVDTLDATGVAAPTNPADAFADLAWSGTNATQITVSGGGQTFTSSCTTTGPCSLSGSAPKGVAPLTATKYTATATGPGGTATASIVIGVTPDSGSTILAGASPDKIPAGGTAMLSWATTDGSTVTISPNPDMRSTFPYGPHERIPVLPTATTTYTLTSSSGLKTSVTVTVLPTTTPAAGTAPAPTVSITDNNQGHVSHAQIGQTDPLVSSFTYQDQCVEDATSDWLESHASYNRDDPSSSAYLGNGFVHIGAGFAQYNNTQTSNIFHYFDVRGARVMGTYDQSILPYYYFVAGQFGTSDRWFSPIPTNSPSSRLYSMAATSHGYAHETNNGIPVKTIWDLLDAAGISWKIYYSDVSIATQQPNTTYSSFPSYAQHKDHIVPVDCTYTGTPGTPATATTPGIPGTPGTPCAAGVHDYFYDVANGTLPAVALIEPGFDSGRDEHPGNGVQPGAAYVAKIVNALMGSPSWHDSAFFLTYDEYGGFYDHVKPLNQGDDPIAVNPDGIAPTDLVPNHDPTGNFNRTGFRVPLIVVSPFAKKHYVWHKNADFTAILTFIEKRFNLPHLTLRDAAQPDMTDFFDFAGIPWATPPSGVPAQPVNAACFQYDRLH